MDMTEDHLLVLAAARHALDRWSDRLASAGREAMAQIPGLVGVLDQHMAEVRACLTDCFGHLSPVALAAYADGLADVAAARGWSADDAGSTGWARASWPSLRLLAVCLVHDADR
jgi:hypothetical protein